MVINNYLPVLKEPALQAKKGVLLFTCLGKKLKLCMLMLEEILELNYQRALKRE